MAEILVAIAIIAVIAAVVVPSVASQLRTGDEGRVHQDLFNIRTAAEQFLADVRRYPQSIAQLVRRPTTVAADSSLYGGVFTTAQVNRWRGPYLAKDSTGAMSTGFETTLNNKFGNDTWSGQAYMTIVFTLDSAYARTLDAKIDDGAKATGILQWSAANPTTVKFYAIPIQ